MAKMQFEEQRDVNGKLTAVTISFQQKITLGIEGALLNISHEAHSIYSNQLCNSI